MISGDPKSEFAVFVLRRLVESGYTALFAGGCVRDLLLGGQPSDYDVATDAKPEEVVRLCARTVPVGVSFGVVRVIGPRPGVEVEVATFRSDGAYVDGRRPESVHFSSPWEDAARRDFTINGLFFDPLNNRVLDYVGGQEDLKRRLLQAIGDPFARFREDKLRLVRAIRFAARFDFAIEPRTSDAVREMASEVHVVAPERIAQELKKMLIHPNRQEAIELLVSHQLAPELFPELYEEETGDASDQVKAMPIDHSEIHGRRGAPDWPRIGRALGALPAEPSFPLTWATLYAGPRGADRVARASRRLRLSNAERDRAVWLLEHQDALIDPQHLPIAKRKRLLSKTGAEELIELHRALAIAAGRSLDHVEYCRSYRADCPDGPLRPQPLIRGAELKELGLRPGPTFKDWLERIYDAQLEGAFSTREEAREWVRRQIEGNR